MRFLTLALTAALLTAQTSGYRAEIQAFQKQREAEIGGPTGWIALADLQWLTPGTHTIGRAASNDIVLNAPSAPPKLGTLTVTGTGATLAVAPNVKARVKDEPVTTATLKAGTSSDDGLEVGGMTVVLIRRGDRMALRVWDESAPARRNFHGLVWYPIDPSWRFDARWVPHDPVPRVKIVNILGELVEMPNPGSVEFARDGQTYRLEALLESDDADQLFFMFRDGTSGKETYVAGRYLYTDLPKDGHVVVDFNRADNPPCAFTDFATCPLPPPRNRLTLRVTAGELNHAHGG